MNEYSIQTNPERVERPKQCIEQLMEDYHFHAGLIKELEHIISISDRPLSHGKPWQAYLPAFMQEWFIPKGDYCYKRIVEVNASSIPPGTVVKICPFWDAYEDSWETMCPGGVPEAVCHLKGMDDISATILDDQCKECGINDWHDEEDDDESAM